MATDGQQDNPSRTDFEALTPTLLAVTRRLHRDTLLHDAAQALDLVHDFYVEKWPSVQRNYDAAKGSLRAYAAVAFAAFARERLAREAKWRRMLGLPIIELPSDDTDDAGREIDRDRMRSALARLDRSDRDLLLARFAEDEESERALAKRLGVSRYRMREMVATALARLAVALQERGRLTTGELEIARLLFAEQMPLSTTAARLGVTEARVRSAKRRILETLRQEVGAPSKGA